MGTQWTNGYRDIMLRGVTTLAGDIVSMSWKITMFFSKINWRFFFLPFRTTLSIYFRTSITKIMGKTHIWLGLNFKAIVLNSLKKLARDSTL